MLNIRKLKKEDAKELAHNIVLIWNDTYKGIVDDDLLNGLSAHEEESVKKLENKIDENYYILEDNGKIVGWTYFTYESEDYNNAAEIHSLYVIKEYHGKGYGKHLLEFAMSDIKNHGINKAVIGCLDKNPSNEFYKHMNGKFIKKRLFRDKYEENLYLFEI